MGVSFSCPLAAYCDLDNALDSAIVKSIAFKDDDDDSDNFKRQDSEPKMLESLNDSRKMLISEEMAKLPLFHNSSSSPKHEAAIKLQKVYKSFRTRRKLADCAVLIEQSWWKLLDFAELKHSSISFFDLDKHETAISRWSRARTRAAKVGKGLSKNSKAQKLALQHWLEAIDPRHRYGHNLHFYYVKWLHSQSKEPFFYWLDIGEGKEVNIVEKCPRSKLQQQCIKYLGPMERKAYEVAVEDGKLFYKQTGEFLDNSEEPKAKWIFILSTTRTLYVAKKKKGSFQHSSFLAGGATLAAGRIVVDKGILKAVWPHSGHYRPTPENFLDFISFLKENNVALNDVKLDCGDDDEEEESLRREKSAHMRNNSSDEESTVQIALNVEDSTLERNISTKEVSSNAITELPEPKPLNHFVSRLESLERLKSENQAVDLELNDNTPPESPLDDGYETAEEIFAVDEIPNSLSPNKSSKDHIDATQVETVSGESVLERISSVKGRKSYQLGKQLSCKWSTGAGPRIGCVREYPSELQCHALEQVNLSPRSLSREARSTSSSPIKGNLQHQFSKPYRTLSSPLCR